MSAERRVSSFPITLIAQHSSLSTEIGSPRGGGRPARTPRVPTRSVGNGAAYVYGRIVKARWYRPEARGDAGRWLYGGETMQARGRTQGGGDSAHRTAAIGGPGPTMGAVQILRPRSARRVANS